MATCRECGESGYHHSTWCSFRPGNEHKRPKPAAPAEKAPAEPQREQPQSEVRVWGDE